MLQFLAKLFGTKSDRDVKQIQPYVDLTHAAFQKLQSLSDEGLRGASAELKQRIQEGIGTFTREIADIKERIHNEESIDLDEKEKLFLQIDKLEKDRDVELEKVLLNILPEAFAVVKETARRLAENKQLEVDATDWDKEVAQKRKGVLIQGGRAIWSNEWLAAGQEIIWNMVHYDVQLMGGVVLHEGKISEMATGEGKTLVSTLPAFLNALSGFGVHIVTVNDYLAKRDSEWNAPLFEFHGLKVDCIDKHQPHSEQRQEAYKADIVYGTNNEFGFDYLRDNMVSDPAEMVQRKHHFAMVDEVDSVLVDDARTPLIISGPVARSGEQLFYDLKPRIYKLVEEQKKLVQDFLSDAKKRIAEGNTNEKEGGLALFRAHRGLPKYKPLIKFLSENGIKTVLQKTENFHLQDNSKEMPKADQVLFFTIDEKSNSVDLTEKGLDAITSGGEDAHFFVLPDLGVEMSHIEKDTFLDAATKLERTEQLISEYKIKSERIHTINQLLKAYTLFEKDTEYILVDGKVKIVDENTGRVLDGRRYSDGLHQAIEAKENVKVEEATQTYATITLQNYFRMYHKLAGMTGTAMTEAAELWEIYKLDVVTIPTNIPTKRKDMEDKVYRSIREKFNAVAEEIVALNQAGRPVLVGTTSVEISEVLSRMLTMRKIKHSVLNAKYHQKEAEIVFDAGKPGAVTIATNMAGRGTDIKLTPESRAAGGLAIIGTERHESRRVDRQLRGRSGRQGDPGSSQFFVCLEDNLMRLFGSDRIANLMDKMGLEEGEVIQHSLVTKSIERAQRKVEENNFGMRKRLLEYDDVMNMQRNAIYSKRRNALFGDKLALDIADMIYDMASQLTQQLYADQNVENFKFQFIGTFGVHPEFSEEEYKKIKPEVLTQNFYQQLSQGYGQRNEMIAQKSWSVFNELQMTKGSQIENVVVPITDQQRYIQVVVNLAKAYQSKGLALSRAIEKFTVLSFIDMEWKEHLRDMDDLKQSVQNAVYEQKDPLLVYKGEAYELFNKLVSKMNEDTLSFLFKSDIHQEETKQYQAPAVSKQPKVKEIKEDLNAPEPRVQEVEKLQPLKSEKIFGRNDTVTVQYLDGTTKTDKFKKLEEDIRNSRCFLVEV